MTLVLETTPEGVILHVRVRPGSPREGIVGEHDGAVKIHVHPAPEGGKANKAVVAVVARALGVAKSAVEVVAGATSSQKRLLIRGGDASTIQENLASLLDAG